jgi:hypothetical protein
MGGPCRPWKDLEPGRCTMPTPHPRYLTSRPQHLASRPRHLPASRWPWRLGLAAFGPATAALAALSPRPSCCPPTATTTPDTLPRATDRPPGRAGTQARTDAHHRPAAANHLPTPSAPTPDTVPRAPSRATGAPGTATWGTSGARPSEDKADSDRRATTNRHLRFARCSPHRHERATRRLSVSTPTFYHAGRR